MLQSVFECIFFTVCGWVGHVLVRMITLGRVKLDWGTDSESNVTEAIGAIFLLMIGFLVVTFVV